MLNESWFIMEGRASSEAKRLYRNCFFAGMIFSKDHKLQQIVSAGCCLKREE
jgi:hypothetical protein